MSYCKTRNVFMSVPCGTGHVPPPGPVPAINRINNQQQQIAVNIASLTRKINTCVNLNVKFKCKFEDSIHVIPSMFQ